MLCKADGDSANKNMSVVKITEKYWNIHYLAIIAVSIPHEITKEPSNCLNFNHSIENK